MSSDELPIIPLAELKTPEKASRAAQSPPGKAAWSAFHCKYFATEPAGPPDPALVLPDPSGTTLAPDMVEAFAREVSLQERLARAIGNSLLDSLAIGMADDSDPPEGPWFLLYVVEFVFLPTTGALTPLDDYRPEALAQAAPRPTAWAPLPRPTHALVLQQLKRMKGSAGRHAVVIFGHQPHTRRSPTTVRPAMAVIVNLRNFQMVAAIPYRENSPD